MLETKLISEELLKFEEDFLPGSSEYEMCNWIKCQTGISQNTFRNYLKSARKYLTVLEMQEIDPGEWDLSTVEYSVKAEMLAFLCLYSDRGIYDFIKNWPGVPEHWM